MNFKWIKKNAFFVSVISFTLIILLGSLNAFADVIITESGDIYLGKIKNVGKEGMTIVSAGKSFTIPWSNFSSSNPDIKSLAGVTVTVEMSDHSILEGEVDNYDDEVGLLLKTKFGVITIPPDKIKSVTEKNIKNAYRGNIFNVGILGACYFPVRSFSKNFAIQPFLSAFGEFRIPYAGGLYLGVELGYQFLKYTPIDNVKYYSFYEEAYAQYRFLQLRAMKSGARILVPFLGAGAGFIYIDRRDERNLSLLLNVRTRLQEIDVLYSVFLGLDIYAMNNFVIRITGGWRGIQQSSSVLSSMYTGLGLVYAY